jgi:hypothetical protein
VFLVALGIAAHIVGWDTLLWLPGVILDSLMWIPETAVDAVQRAPATTGVIALGVALMVVARLVSRRSG